jgi:acetylornithine/N-succinyldiaminopimelate aminotransferase
MLETLDKNHVIQTYTRNYTNFTHGSNATLFDDTEKEYIDFTSGIGVVSIGHAHPKMVLAISEQAAKIMHISNLYVIEPQAKLAQAISNAYSDKNVKTFFANSGAEANEGAIKIARKYGELEGQENGLPKKYKIITLAHSFHGRTITTVKATGQPSMHNYFGPFPDGFTYAEDIDAIEAQLDDHTVAVMIELVQGEGGVEALNKAKVQTLAAMLKKRGVLLIVDEVQTGVYRTGAFTASQSYGIEPDIITLAKGLGGGVPIGAIVTALDVLKAGDHGSTFGGNYLVTTAALTVLDVLEQESESGDLAKRTEYFTKKQEALFAAHSDIFEKCVGVGLIRGIRVKDAETLASVVTAAHQAGVLVLKAGRNTLRFLPPLTISNEEIDKGFERLEDAISSL